MKKRTSALLFAFAIIAAGFTATPVTGQAEFQPGKVKVTTSVLRVRNIPSKAGRVVGKVYGGKIYDAIERSRRASYLDGQSKYWYKVRYRGKKAGWVFGAYVTFDVNAESGLRWTTVSPGYGRQYRGIAAPGGGTIMVGGGRGSIFISRNYGQRWRRLAPQALGTNIGNVNKMLVTKKRIWIAASGASGGGIWRTANNGKSWSQYTVAQGLPSNDVFDIQIAPGGKMWVATSGGVASSGDGGRTWKKYGPPGNPGGGGAVLSLAISGERVFVGTRKGLYIVKVEKSFFGGGKKVWARIGEGQPNIGNRIQSMVATKDGKLWIGSDRGLSWTNAAKAEKFFGIGGQTPVNTVFVDGKGRIMVATNNGLNVSTDKGDSWITYKRENGLAGNRITGISVAPTKAARIWVSLGRSGVAYSR